MQCNAVLVRAWVLRETRRELRLDLVVGDYGTNQQHTLVHGWATMLNQ